MKTTLGAIATAALLLAGAPQVATAGDHYGSVKDGPVAAPAQTWTGFYVGAAIGYSNADLDFAHDLFLGIVDYPGLPGGVDYDVLNVTGHDASGLTGTVTLGFDRQFSDRFVGGAFVDYTFGHQDDEVTLIYPNVPGPINFGDDATATLTFKNNWAVGGRLGYLIRPSTLVHVSAGYTQANVELSGNRGFLEQDLHGYFIGVGAEHMIRDSLALTLDYRYSDYGDERLGGIDNRPCCAESFDVDAKNHNIRFGLTWRMPIRRSVAHTPLK